jgi:hypothetical protein
MISLFFYPDHPVYPVKKRNPYTIKLAITKKGGDTEELALTTLTCVSS